MLTTWKLTTAPDIALPGRAGRRVVARAHGFRPRVHAVPVDCGPASEQCPLQGLMVDEISNAVVANDGPRLAAALERVAAASPDASWSWASTRT